jgi:hypothetical protein
VVALGERTSALTVAGPPGIGWGCALRGGPAPGVRPKGSGCDSSSAASCRTALARQPFRNRQTLPLTRPNRLSNHQ